MATVQETIVQIREAAEANAPKHETQREQYFKELNAELAVLEEVFKFAEELEELASSTDTISEREFDEAGGWEKLKTSFHDFRSISIIQKFKISMKEKDIPIKELVERILTCQTREAEYFLERFERDLAPYKKSIAEWEEKKQQSLKVGNGKLAQQAQEQIDYYTNAMNGTTKLPDEALPGISEAVNFISETMDKLGFPDVTPKEELHNLKRHKNLLTIATESFRRMCHGIGAIDAVRDVMEV
nr:hypothetical protein 22 [bacterium]